MKLIIKRFVAYYIDVVLVNIFFVVPTLLILDLNLIYDRLSIIILFAIFHSIYFFVFELYKGQTIGKKLLKIRVLGKNSNKSRVRVFLIRTLLRFVPFDSISIFFNDFHTMFHDKYSSTEVILTSDNKVD